MDNSSSGDRRDRSSQNRQGQRGGRRRQNNRGESRNSGGGQNRRNRSGGGSRNQQGGGKREYRPTNRGRQAAKKPSFGQRLLSILTFGLIGGSSTPASSGKPSSDNRNDRQPSQGNRSRDNNRPAENVEVSSARLYVGNLDYKTTDADLTEHFSKLGTVKSAEIVINRRTQQSKGFAFVEMESIDEAKKAVDSYHNEEFMGRRMLVSGAKSSGASEGDRDSNSGNNRNRSQRSDSNRSDRSDRNDRNSGRERGNNRRSEAREEPARRPKKTEAPVELTGSRLRLDNLDYEVGEEELEELFKGIGVVVGTEVTFDPDTHQSKGFGFVEMSHIDEAKRAVEILNNKDFMGRRLAMSDGGEKAEEKAPVATDIPAATEAPAAEETPATEEAPASEEIAAAEEKNEEDQNETTPAVGA